MTRRTFLLWVILVLDLSLAGCLDSSGAEESSAALPSSGAVTTPALVAPGETQLPTPTVAPSRTPAPLPTETLALKATQAHIGALIPTDTPAPTGTPTATPTAQQFMWSGGYSFWQPSDYELRSEGGQAVLTSRQGVMTLVGGIDPNAAQPPDAALGEILAAINQSMVASLQLGPPFAATVDGVAGTGADLSGTTAAGQMLGRLVSVRPAAGQLFYAFAVGPAGVWPARGAGDFERLLNGIHFMPLGSSFGCPQSLDPTYGFSPDNPIRIGGGDQAAPGREAAFLGNLIGASGGLIQFQPAGSQPFGGGTLDIYQIAFQQAGQPVMLYFDRNNFAPLFAPAGFGCLGAIPVAAP